MNTLMTKDEFLALAEHAHHYTNLLIKQCDSWLPGEEGMKNVEERIKRGKVKHNSSIKYL